MQNNAAVDEENIFKIVKCVCDEKDVIKCKSMKRIEFILNLFKQVNNSNENIQYLQCIFRKNKYSNTDLINDFYHIKYDHDIDNNNQQFEKIYKYIINNIEIICDGDCKYVERHYMDRSKLQNQYIQSDEKNDEQFNVNMQLISRTHVYFIHS
eukprot:222259_1